MMCGIQERKFEKEEKERERNWKFSLKKRIVKQTILY